MQQFNTEEGRVVKTSGTYQYEYYLRDHLGSVRARFKAGENNTAELQAETHYYPYGMQIAGLSQNYEGENTELFSGKHLQNHDLGAGVLAWYDFGARNYDPQLGMWFNVDPMLEKYSTFSPYNYCMNNPVNFIDPDGMDPEKPLWWSDETMPRWGSFASYMFAGMSLEQAMPSYMMSGGGGGSSRSSSGNFIRYGKNGNTDYGGKYAQIYFSTILMNLSTNQKIDIINEVNQHNSNPDNKDNQINMQSLLPPVYGSISEYTYHNYFHGRSGVRHYYIPRLEVSVADVAANGGGYYEDPMFYINGGIGVASTGATIKGGYHLSNELYHYTRSSGNLHFRGGKYWNNPFVNNSKAAIAARGGAWRSAGTKLGYAGIAITTGDALMSGEFRTSQGINVAMTTLAIAVPGVGSIVAGVYFVADIGLTLSTGRGIGDRIDAATGGTHELYNGLY